MAPTGASGNTGASGPSPAAGHSPIDRYRDDFTSGAEPSSAGAAMPASGVSCSPAAETAAPPAPAATTARVAALSGAKTRTGTAGATAAANAGARTPSGAATATAEPGTASGVAASGAQAGVGERAVAGAVEGPRQVAGAGAGAGTRVAARAGSGAGVWAGAGVAVTEHRASEPLLPPTHHTPTLTLPHRTVSEAAYVHRAPSEDFRSQFPVPTSLRCSKHEVRGLYRGLLLLGLMSVASFYGVGVLSGCKGGSLGCEGVPGSPYRTRPRGPQMHELASRNGVVSRLVLPAVNSGTEAEGRWGVGIGGRSTRGSKDGSTGRGGMRSVVPGNASTSGGEGTDTGAGRDGVAAGMKEGIRGGSLVGKDRTLYGTTLYGRKRLTMGVPLAPMLDMPLWFKYVTSASHQGASNHENDVIPVRALRALMSRIAINNTVIIVSTNLGFFNMSLNVLCRLEDLGATNVLTWALDEGSAKALRDRSLPYYYDTATFSVSNYTSYFDFDYIRMMIERPSVWWRLLATGYDLIFIDSDVVLFENPMGLFPRVGDIEGQIDAKFWLEAERQDRVPDMCAGAFWLRSSPTTLRFLDHMKGAIEKHAVRERFDDQYALNSIIRDPKLAVITNRGAQREKRGEISEEDAGGRLRVHFVEPTRIMGGRLEKFSTREVDKKDYYNVTFVFKGRGGKSRRVHPGLFHLNGRGLEYIKLKMLKKSGWWEVQEDGYCRTKEGMRREIALQNSVDKEREAAAAEAMAAERIDEDGTPRKKGGHRKGSAGRGDKGRGTHASNAKGARK